MGDDQPSQQQASAEIDVAAGPKAATTWVEKLVAWIDKQSGGPNGRLLISAWILLSGPCALFLALVEARYCAPRRLAIQEREVAIREGRYYQPKVSVATYFSACSVKNSDERAIRHVWLMRDFFRIDLSDSCSRSRSDGPSGWAHAEVLSPGSLLAERPGTNPGGPGLMETAATVAPGDCPQDHDCVVVVECRAHYLRDADLEPYANSAWAVLDPRKGPTLEAADSLAKATLVAGGARPEWKDDRHRRAFACVKELLARDAQRDERLTIGQDAIRSLVPR